MATLIPVAIEKYLNTTYRPDREYVDGEVRERNVGMWTHARLQALLAHWFATHETEWGVMGSMEQRTRTSSTRVRVPDLVCSRGWSAATCDRRATSARGRDSLSGRHLLETEDRSRDYMNMGVETVWLIDPKTRTGRMCVSNVWTSSSRLEVPGTPIYAEFDELFGFLDKPPAVANGNQLTQANY